MLPEYKRKTSHGVGLGLIGEFVARVMQASSDPTTAHLGTLLLLPAAVLFIWGCVQYAKGKGQSGWFGALGLLSILGLIVLVFLPDRRKAVPA